MGSAIGVDILTDARQVHIQGMDMEDLGAGMDDPYAPYDGPNESPRAIGLHIGKAVDKAHLKRICARDLVGARGESIIDDDSGSASVYLNSNKSCTR